MVHRRVIPAYWHPEQNVGDTLTPFILEYFLNADIKQARRNDLGKVLGVGSILPRAVRSGDIVWGSGTIREAEFRVTPDVKVLAVRGKLTRELMKGTEVPEVYGDPALLLPLMYKPEVEKRYKFGIVPHYVDMETAKLGFPALNVNGEYKLIDVRLPWQRFVREVLSCEAIISSSLHGIVIAEAYGIPANWQVWSDKVIGNGFKFRDYLTGTGRKPQEPGWFPPIYNLPDIQKGLLDALKQI